MNVSMEYETPPADSLPMDDDEEEDDYEEVHRSMPSPPRALADEDVFRTLTSILLHCSTIAMEKSKRSRSILHVAYAASRRIRTSVKANVDRIFTANASVSSMSSNLHCVSIAQQVGEKVAR